MEPFTVVSGAAAPLLEDDVNNTAIVGGGSGSGASRDLAEAFFGRRRRRDDGSEDPGFVFNRPQFRQAKILVTGKNYGCGSSSESSVWAPVAFGIRCIVARSFADIYRENCLRNGILPIVLDPTEASAFEVAVVEVDGQSPFTVDLLEQRVSGGGSTWSFSISPGERRSLLEGLDPIAYTLKYADAIGTFEQRSATSTPWLQRVGTPQT